MWAIEDVRDIGSATPVGEYYVVRMTSVDHAPASYLMTRAEFETVAMKAHMRLHKAH